MILEKSTKNTDTFAIQCLEYDQNSYTGSEITQAVVDKLAQLIQAGKVDSIFLSLDENREDNFFTMVTA